MNTEHIETVIISESTMSSDRKLDLKLFFKSAVFVTAVILFAWQTRDVIEKYFDKKTTISTQTLRHDALKSPAISLQMDNVYKTHLAEEKYGLPSKFIYGSETNQLAQDLGMTHLELYRNLSYSLGVDFTLSMNEFTHEHFLSAGKNAITLENGKKLDIFVTETHTLFSGLVYTLEIDQPMKLGEFLFFKFDIINEKDLGPDLPMTFQWYLSEQDERYGHILGSWFGIEPYTFQARLGEMVVVYYTESRHRFTEDDGKKKCHIYNRQEGNAFLKCKYGQIAERMRSACKSTCYSPPLKTLMEIDDKNEIPECQDKEIFDCFEQNYFSMHLQPIDECPDQCEKVEYGGRIQKQRGWSNTSVLLELQLGSDKISIYQEYLLFDFPSFVGSIGGSLGLFIGFSYFDCASLIIDIISKRLK